MSARVMLSSVPRCDSTGQMRRLSAIAQLSRLIVPLVGAVSLVVEIARGEDQPSTTKQIDFVADIQPIFEAKCVKCHGPEKQKSGYRLDEKNTALHGGDEHAPNIKPGDADGSPLVRFVAG